MLQHPGASMTRKAQRGRPPRIARTSNDTTAPPRPDFAAPSPAHAAGATAGRGSTRARRPGALQPARQLQRALALRLHAQDSVSMPLSTTQALNGDRLMPRCASPARTCRRPASSARTARRPSRGPARQVLGARVHHQSAPNFTGCCRAGEQKQLSTASSAPGRGQCRPAPRCRTPRSAGWWASRRTAAWCWAAAPHATRQVGLRDEGGLDAELGELLQQLDGGAEHLASTPHGRPPSAAPITSSRMAPCRWPWRCSRLVPSSAASRRSIIVTWGWRSGCRRRRLLRWRSAAPRWRRRGARSSW
jgi:hypothetical protein